MNVHGGPPEWSGRWGVGRVRKQKTQTFFLVYKKAEETKHAILLSAPFLILENIPPPLLLFPINPRLSKVTYHTHSLGSQRSLNGRWICIMQLRIFFSLRYFSRRVWVCDLSFHRLNQSVCRGPAGGSPASLYTRLYSFRLSCRMVSLTAAKTKRMFSVSVAQVKWE